MQIAFADIAADGPAVDAAPAPGRIWQSGCAIFEGCAPQAALPRCAADLAAQAVSWPIGVCWLVSPLGVGAVTFRF